MNYQIDLPVSEDFQNHDGVLFIEPTSAEVHKDALELLAEYFKKEFKYDYLQYENDGNDKYCVGVLFVEKEWDLVEHIHHHPHRVIGGACFRMLENEAYILDWVWFHPFARNRKNLRKHWASFKSKFGEFQVTPPLSAQMAKFLEENA